MLRICAAFPTQTQANTRTRRQTHAHARTQKARTNARTLLKLVGEVLCDCITLFQSEIVNQLLREPLLIFVMRALCFTFHRLSEQARILDLQDKKKNIPGANEVRSLRCRRGRVEGKKRAVSLLYSFTPLLLHSFTPSLTNFTALLLHSLDSAWRSSSVCCCGAWTSTGSTPSSPS